MILSVTSCHSFSFFLKQAIPGFANCSAVQHPRPGTSVQLLGRFITFAVQVPFDKVKAAKQEVHTPDDVHVLQPKGQETTAFTEHVPSLFKVYPALQLVHFGAAPSLEMEQAAQFAIAVEQAGHVPSDLM